MGRKVKDYTGMQIGILTVVSLAHKTDGHAYWNCICSCGKERVVNSSLVGKKRKKCLCNSRNNSEYLIGKKFGKLTVVSKSDEPGCSRWNCDCKCGLKSSPLGTTLLSGQARSCGCGPKEIDLTGKIFKRWTVIKKDSVRKWLCRCECGAEKIVFGNSLKSGLSGSCGCLKIEKHIIDKSGANSHFYQHGNKWLTLYRNAPKEASKRNHEWGLTLEEFISLCSGNCDYCGDPPRPMNTNRINKVKNGIDRVDNNIGYLVENCVTCCSVCNYMKRNLSKEEFLEKCKRITILEKNKTNQEKKAQ